MNFAFDRSRGNPLPHSINIHRRIWTAKRSESILLYFYETSCGRYAQDRKLPKGVGNHASDEAFIGGWLSAYNVIVPGGNIKGDTRLDDTLLWLDRYCLDHPFSTMQNGLIDFTRNVAPSLAKW